MQELIQRGLKELQMMKVRFHLLEAQFHRVSTCLVVPRLSSTGWFGNNIANVKDQCYHEMEIRLDVLDVLGLVVTRLRY